MFHIDELVVYPAQGVGRVESITSHDVGGSTNDYYVVRILNNDGTLLVPVENAVNVGLRTICDNDYGMQILASMQDWSDFRGYAGQNWNRRYREYSEKLKTGQLEDVAYVLKELILISQDKDLSFGERRLMEQAMALITMELAYALGREPVEIQGEIENIFHDVLKKSEL
ncbi:MAG: CarD family transcriptional regulator [Desulfovermiculus sp.]|nr:CarD family transcriptional regulator [Desulfovermiculus sp.]